MDKTNKYELRIIEKNLQRQKMVSEFETKHNIAGETIDAKIESVQTKIQESDETPTP